MNLMDLSIKVGIDDQASKGVASLSDKLKNGLGGAAKIGAAAVATVAAGVTALGVTMAKGIKETAEYGDNIDKMSQKMGLSAEAYQEWDFIMKHNGTTIEGLKPAMKTLANAAETSSDAFQKLGMSQKEISKMSQEELFSATIKNLQNVEDVTERTYLAGKLLGRGATELGPLLNMTAEETENMRKQVHELGGVMSNESVKSAAAFQDSLQNLKTATSGLSRGLFSEFLPSITTVMDGLTMIFSGDDSGVNKIADGVFEFTTKITEAMPKVLDAGTKIVKALMKAITDNLPLLLESGIQALFSFLEGINSVLPTVITSLVDALPLLIEAALELLIGLAEAIADNIDIILDAVLEAITKIVETLMNPEALSKLIEAGIEILLALVHGIVDAIPQLIAMIPTVIKNIVDVLLSNLGLIISAAIEIIMALINGLLEAIPDLIAMVPEIIMGIITGIIDNLDKIIMMAPQIIMALISGLISAIPKLVAAIPKIIKSIIDVFTKTDWGKIGKNIIDGLLNGLKTFWKNLTKWVSDAWNSLVGGIKSFLGIHSPSKLFADIGKNMALGVGVGWEDTFKDVDKEINDSMSFGDIDYGVSTVSSVDGSTNSPEVSKTEVVISVDDSQNLMGFARALLPLLKIAEKEVYA